MTSSQRSATGLPGRQGEARRNDVRILDAARQVLGANPSASMAEIGRAAGVGMSALYSRYENKDQLIDVLLEESHLAYDAGIKRALARLDAGEDAWEVYADYLRSVLDSPAHSAPPGATDFAAALERVRNRWGHLVDDNAVLFERVQRAGVLREGLGFVDVGVMLNGVGMVRGTTAERSQMLRKRVLEMVLEGMRSGLPRLPGEPATGADYTAP